MPVGCCSAPPPCSTPCACTSNSCRSQAFPWVDSQALEPCQFECLVTKVALRRNPSQSGIALAWLAKRNEELRVEITQQDTDVLTSRTTEPFIRSAETGDSGEDDIWVCQSSWNVAGGMPDASRFMFDVRNSTELEVRVFLRTIAWLQRNTSLELLAAVRFRVDADVIPAVLADGELCMPLVQDGHVKGKVWLSVSLHCKGEQIRDDGFWAQSRHLVILQEGHKDGITSCAVFPSGDKVLTVSQDGVGSIWTSSTGTLVTQMHGHSDSITSCAVFPSGDSVVTSSLDDSCMLWSSSGARLKSMHVVGYFAVFPSGERVHLQSNSKYDDIWSTLGEQLPVRCGHTDSITACAVFPVSQLLLTVSGDGTGIIWSPSGEPLVRLEGHSGAVADCAIFPLDEKVLTVSRDKTGIIWRKSGEQVATLRGHRDGITSCAVFPPGDKVLTASLDGSAVIWSSGGDVLATLRGHSDAINACAVFPSCEHVITASQDNTAMIWSVCSGTTTGVLRGHTHGITSCSVWPSGKRVLTVSDDRTGIIWPVAPYVSAAAQGEVLLLAEEHGTTASPRYIL